LVLPALLRRFATGSNIVFGSERGDSWLPSLKVLSIMSSARALVYATDILIFKGVPFLTGFDRISAVIPIISFHFLESRIFNTFNRMLCSSRIIVVTRPRAGKLASSAISMAVVGRLDVARRLRATSLLMGTTTIAVVAALVVTPGRPLAINYYQNITYF
jgi:hypothetical protein